MPVLFLPEEVRWQFIESECGSMNWGMEARIRVHKDDLEVMHTSHLHRKHNSLEVYR